MIFVITGALAVVKQHLFQLCKFSKPHSLLEFVVWLTPEHHLRDHDFMIIFISGAVVLVKQHMVLGQGCNKNCEATMDALR